MCVWSKKAFEIKYFGKCAFSHAGTHFYVDAGRQKPRETCLLLTKASFTCSGGGGGGGRRRRWSSLSSLRTAAAAAFSWATESAVDSDGRRQAKSSMLAPLLLWPTQCLSIWIVYCTEVWPFLWRLSQRRERVLDRHSWPSQWPLAPPPPPPQDRFLSGVFLYLTSLLFPVATATPQGSLFATPSLS